MTEDLTSFYPEEGKREVVFLLLTNFIGDTVKVPVKFDGEIDGQKCKVYMNKEDIELFDIDFLERYDGETENGTGYFYWVDKEDLYIEE